MKPVRKAILLGMLVWLVPFLVAFAAISLKESWRSLFESIMALTLTIVVVSCTLWYFRSLTQPSARVGLLLGLAWYVICVAIDLPLMLNPPLNYTLGEYFADIGLTYAMIPVITTGMALAYRTSTPPGYSPRPANSGDVRG